MKYKIIGLSVAILALVLIITISIMLPEEKAGRYIEHRDASKKAECIEADNEELCTHLPIVVINTDGVDVPGKTIIDEDGRKHGYSVAEDGSTDIKAKISITDNVGTNNHLHDAPTDSGDIRIRVRGHSSRKFDKPNYLIKFIEEDGTNAPREFLGMKSHHEWALHGPFLDKSLIRNYMWYNIAGEIMDYSPNVRYFELVLNGEYRGLYLATETITAGKEGARLNLEVNKKDNTFSGYIIRLDWGDTEEVKLLYPFTSYVLRAKTQHELVFPNPSNVSPELKNAIKNEFSLFEKTLYSYDYNNKKYGYKNYVDIDSFVDYFLINELTCNYDAGSLSTYIYKGIDGKYRMCVWDFNSACDFYQERAMDTENFVLNNVLWYQMLFMDKDFTNRVVERYEELRKTYFSEEYLFDFIDSTVDYLGDAVDRNYKKWGYTFGSDYDMLSPAERNVSSHEESVIQIKEFLSARLKFMDENIKALKQYSAESKTKKYNEATD